MSGGSSSGGGSGGGSSSGGTKYTQKDAASDTRVSGSEAAAAWHQARDDAAGTMNVPADRHSSGGSSGSGKKK